MSTPAASEERAVEGTSAESSWSGTPKKSCEERSAVANAPVRTGTPCNDLAMEGTREARCTAVRWINGNGMDRGTGRGRRCLELRHMEFIVSMGGLGFRDECMHAMIMMAADTCVRTPRTPWMDPSGHSGNKPFLESWCRSTCSQLGAKFGNPVVLFIHRVVFPHLPDCILDTQNCSINACRPSWAS